jgi:hypothetical protein
MCVCIGVGDKVVGYIRVSTDDQAENGAGLAAQREAFRVPDDDRRFVDAVRASLRRHKFPRGEGSYRPRYVVSDAMMRLVAEDLRLAHRS